MRRIYIVLFLLSIIWLSLDFFYRKTVHHKLAYYKSLKQIRIEYPRQNEILTSTSTIVKFTIPPTIPNQFIWVMVNSKTRYLPYRTTNPQQIKVTLFPGENMIELYTIPLPTTVPKLVGSVTVKVIPLTTHTYTYVSVKIKLVSLTFDGNEEARESVKILNILKSKRVRCTMFLTGIYIRRYPEIVKRIIQDGHEVGNHTDTHPHLTNKPIQTIDESFIRQELTACSTTFYKLTSQPMTPFWRAPFGEYNNRIISWAVNTGYIHIAWPYGKKSLDTIDWVADTQSPLYRTGDRIVSRILSLAQEGIEGGIILMHLGNQRKSDKFYDKLPELIDGLRNQGYLLVTVSDLITDSLTEQYQKFYEQQ